jgi:hypothetical protein
MKGKIDSLVLSIEITEDVHAVVDEKMVVATVVVDMVQVEAEEEDAVVADSQVVAVPEAMDDLLVEIVTTITYLMQCYRQLDQDTKQCCLGDGIRCS